jgi:large subunit ribosomal protein L37Ae
MGKTKKVGASGKFGTRYGMRLRKRWLEVDKKQKAQYVCPTCRRPSVKRVSSGVWECKKCNTKFAGGAYQPVTDAAKKMEQSIKEDENV